MAARTIEGKNCKVTIGENKVAGIGEYKYTPGTVNEIPDDEFEDTTEKIKIGMRKRGTITFSGIAKIGDAAGQDALEQAFINGSPVNNLRLYQDKTNYLEPNSTTGYLNPNSTTGNSTLPTTVNITAFDKTADKSGSAKITFTATVSGDMVEVGS